MSTMEEAQKKAEELMEQARAQRIQTVRQMRTEGATWQEIGQALGVSRQRAETIGRKAGITIGRTRRA